MSVPYYPGITITPTLGMSLVGMDEVVAENFVLIDAFAATGTSVQINGSPISNPNFNNPTPASPVGALNVTFQTDAQGHVSAYAPFSQILGDYTFFIVSGTVYAQNMSTGNIDFSNTDAAVVINDAIAAIASTGGRLYFKTGIYNLNSLTLDSQSGNYYGVAIPPSASSSTVYVQWIFEGEFMPPYFEQFADSKQDTGTIFLVTSTAISNAPANVNICAFFCQHDTVNGIGPQVTYKNLGVRFPTNQRGNETAIDNQNSIATNLENVLVDFDIEYPLLSFPVAGTDGLYGVTTSPSGKQQHYWTNVAAVGYDVGLDVQSEHSTLVNCYPELCNFGIQYAVRGGSTEHSSTFIACGSSECARALTIGSNAKGQLDIISFDIEDATASVFPAWEPVYHAKDSSTGYGTISWFGSQGGTGGELALATIFDGGGGTRYAERGNGNNIISMTAAASSAFTTNMIRIGGSNQMGAFNFSSASTLTAANGPYYMARGNTYSAISTQRGTMFMSAGNPSTPAQGEGEIQFYTGADLLRASFRNDGTLMIGASYDLGISRSAAGVLAVGSGSAGSTAGKLAFGSASSINGKATAGLGVPAEYTQEVATAQAANFNSGSAFTLLSAPATGVYRVTVYSIVTQAATNSSTLPSNTVGWTDPTSSITQSFAATATNSGNTTTTFVQNSILIYAKTGTNITLTQAGFASSGATGMQFTIVATVEAL